MNLFALKNCASTAFKKCLSSIHEHKKHDAITYIDEVHLLVHENTLICITYNNKVDYKTLDMISNTRTYTCLSQRTSWAHQRKQTSVPQSTLSAIWSCETPQYVQKESKVNA